MRCLTQLALLLRHLQLMQLHLNILQSLYQEVLLSRMRTCLSASVYRSSPEFVCGILNTPDDRVLLRIVCHGWLCLVYRFVSWWALVGELGDSVVLLDRLWLSSSFHGIL